MSSGIRATVSFPSSVCPIAECVQAAGTTVNSVATSVSIDRESSCVTEFATKHELDTDGTDIVSVFARGSTHWYRRYHGDGTACPCERLGHFECAVVRYVAREGTLTLAFYAADYEQLQTVVADLRDRYPQLDIKRLVRSPTETGETDSVYVDRGRLTDRQLQTLETAYEMGYFERPRQANATEIATELGIDQSTFSQHLAAAESKLFEEILERPQ